jgi:hypothetical protein
MGFPEGGEGAIVAISMIARGNLRQNLTIKPADVNPQSFFSLQLLYIFLSYMQSTNLRAISVLATTPIMLTMQKNNYLLSNQLQVFV